jgi:aldose 1-epimerase
MAISGAWHRISAGEFEADISEVGAGLAGLRHAGRPVTSPWPADALPPMSCGAVLLPWPNRIREGRYSFGGTDHQLPLTEPAKHNAIHGLVRWERWSVGVEASDSITLTLELVPQTGYPFELSASISYALDPAAGLSVTARVTNRGPATAPFGIGFHPYLDLDGGDYDSTVVGVPAATVLIADGQQIPIGARPVAGTEYQLLPPVRLGELRLDDCFTDLVGSSATVGFDGRVTELWWDESFRFVQAFTAPDRFGRTAVAIEPMTCPANAFNSHDGLITLERGESYTGRWGISARA